MKEGYSAAVKKLLEATNDFAVWNHCFICCEALASEGILSNLVTVLK
jgi:hypothetical protein